MDQARLTPAYTVEVRHRDDQQAHQATEHQDPEVQAVLQRVEGML